jgi:hypothetical protein
VWLVTAEGARRHVGSTCGGSVAYTAQSPKWWYVHPVPIGETEGHVAGPDWFASESTCAALVPG